MFGDRFFTSFFWISFLRLRLFCGVIIGVIRRLDKRHREALAVVDV